MLVHGACCPGSCLYTIMDFLLTSGEKTSPCFILSTGVYPRDGTLLVTAVLDRTELEQEKMNPAVEYRKIFIFILNLFK